MVVLIDAPFESRAKARLDVEEGVSHFFFEGPFSFARFLVRIRKGVPTIASAIQRTSPAQAPMTTDSLSIYV